MSIINITRRTRLLGFDYTPIVQGTTVKMHTPLYTGTVSQILEKLSKDNRFKAFKNVVLLQYQLFYSAVPVFNDLFGAFEILGQLRDKYVDSVTVYTTEGK